MNMIKKSDQKFKKIPRHIAIIMDGNGRWAKKKGLPRNEGHKAGVESIREVTEGCIEAGVEKLTLYAFSTENWKRPRKERTFLMRLLKNYLIKERKRLKENDIKFSFIGRRDKLPKYVLKQLDKTVEMSRDFKTLNLCLAINYGGRSEIVDAAKKLATDYKKNKLELDEIDESNFNEYLYDENPIELDLMIRTAGELRISNFLLWQLSYAELVISDLYWPDFKKEDLFYAITEFENRERRYGGL